jgi:hypothetical protein
MSDFETTGTTRDKERGRVDWGVTSEQIVIYHTAWPNRPYLVVNGSCYVSVSTTGFRLDRKPDKLVYWVAQERPTVGLDINDIRRMLETESNAD